MKAEIHPQWYADAKVVCACGNTWVAGSTSPEIRTDICSACHPFYTGEQRIVDTEGQVERFYKRLEARDQIAAERTAVDEAKKSPDLDITDLELGSRYEKALAAEGITTVGDVINALNEGGDEALLAIKGFGHKALINMKRALRGRGFDLPETEEESS